MTRVLLIEDDPAILRGLADNFAGEGYEVRTARTGEEGLRIVRADPPDLLVLDVMLPGLSGLELCRRLRREGIATPILMLTARGEERDRIQGLDLGADDYVTKPFSIAEVLARSRALLRRAHPSDPLPERIAFDDVTVDFVRYEATKGARAVPLAPKEFAVLRYLAARPGVVVQRADLLLDVWGYQQLPTTRTVDNHVALLRAKLESDPANPRRILTVHGVGYKLVLEEAL